MSRTVKLELCQSALPDLLLEHRHSSSELFFIYIAEPSDTILSSATRAGVEIPTLCYDKRTATYIYCLIGLVFIFSAVGIGGFVDKLTAKIGDPMVARKRVLTVSYIGCAAMAAWLNYGVRLTAGDGTVVWAFVIYALLFGFFYGMYIPSVAGLVGLVTGRKEMPPAWGLISLIGMAGGAGLGPYIAGALRDATGSFFVAIWLSTIFYLVACLLTNMAKRPTPEETAEAQASVK